ncbi:MAG: POTRA domain-containing protein [Flavitalea sp.]
MLTHHKHLLLVFLSCITCLALHAQLNFIVGDITISGNTRTKDYVVRRELPFKTGDTTDLATLVKNFEVARQQLINTKLFNEAIVAVKIFRGYIVDVSIDLKERWYLFPLPYLRPGDRNISEWAKHDYALNRLNYGGKFTQYNFSGRNDKLRLWLTTGYAKQVQLQYDQPYADNHLKNGYKVGFSFTSNREFTFATKNNQQQFMDSLSPLKRYNAFAEYDYRPGLRTFHALRMGYTRLEVDKRIADYNSNYYKDGVNKIDIPEISYTLNYYHVDYIQYPIKGWMGEVSVLKRGIHSYTNMWQYGLKYTLAVPLKQKFNFHWQVQGVIKTPYHQPYYNTQLLGYGDLYLRGLEKYVIDGAGTFVSRQTLRRQLFSVNLSTHYSSPSFDVVPIRVYAKIYTDFGYAMNKTSPENSLANKMLYSTGLGVDVVTFYDFVFRFEYSFNQLGQNGLFLHFRNEF